MADLAAVLADLTAEGDDLDGLIADLGSADWRRDTPAPGWPISHQISHLTWTDEASLLAIENPDAFAGRVSAALADPAGFVDAGAAELALVPQAELLDRWRTGRRRLVEALAAVPAGAKIAWFGPPMGAVSMATARIMETWAHGEDVADALDVTRTPTDRLRNIAHLGVRTRDFAFAVHRRPPPAEEFRVELTGPAGDRWTWGPVDADQRLSGPALDFCRLVTQRSHPDDLALVPHGADVTDWLTIAQAFAGLPGAGRKPKGQQ